MSESRPVSEAELVRGLMEPRAYRHHPASVEYVQTHISHVFLAGDLVYKLKKNVRFSFLDFSTPELRQRACEEELRLNRRLCPEIYLRVVPVGIGGDGALGVDVDAPAVAHLVEMRRLPEEGMLPRMVAENRLTPALVADLARQLARFHETAHGGPAVDSFGAPDTLAERWQREASEIEGFVGDLLRPQDLSILLEFGRRFVDRERPLLERRRMQGRIREGHGDLHCGNICWLSAPGGGFQIFDCIEFSQELRCNDVASELAFLAMDFEALGRRDLSRHLIAAYVDASGDLELSELIPFYGCYRALVRGKVEGLKSRDLGVPVAERESAGARASERFALARRLAWRGSGPLIVAVAGLSGTGKSSLARALADETGFPRLSTDEQRRRSFGIAQDQPTPDATKARIYGEDAKALIYAEVLDGIRSACRDEGGAVADATFLQRRDRDALAAISSECGAQLVFVECRAEEAEVRRRLAARDAPGAQSESDARLDTYLRQCESAEPFAESERCEVVDTNRALRDVVEDATGRIWRRLGTSPPRWNSP